MMSNEAHARYRRDLVAHANAVTAELAKYPDDVQQFMRANFELHMYPLSFTSDFAEKLHAFRSAPSAALIAETKR